MLQVTFSEIQPFIRYVHRFTVPPKNSEQNTRWYDHRLFYILEGEGTFTIEGTPVSVGRGYALLIPSGTEYLIASSPKKPLTAIGVNFDYLSHHAHLTEPIFPRGTYRENERLEHLCFTDRTELNTPLKLSKMNILEQGLLLMLEEYKESLVFSAERLRARFLLALTDILRETALEQSGVRHTSRKAEEILAYIREHHAEPLSGETLSKIFHYHKNHINYLVKLKTGVSVHQYLIHYRLTRAVELLRTTDLSASAVSAEVGFGDYVYFLKCFKKHMGASTKAFRGHF